MKVLKIYNSKAIENFKTVPLYPIKWRPFEVFKKIQERLLLIANIVNGAVSGLKQNWQLKVLKI